MRWFGIKRAELQPEIRELLEQYGPETLRVLLLLPNTVWELSGKRFTVEDNRKFILQWLKEQADREERRETWLITMECAITVFVLVELMISAVGFFHTY